jgi:coproporphyrinogen III oxidase-like Fe-S oxidoreductase
MTGSSWQRNVRTLLAQKNMHLHLDLIAGLPYEDLASFGRSFNAVYALQPHMLQLGF